MRTESILGSCIALPTVGSPFEVRSLPATWDGPIRLVATSKITELAEGEGGLHFRTETGSHYVWTVLP